MPTTAALEASEARFRAAVQAVSGILWTNDAQGRMTGQQDGWAQLTGQSLAEYQGYGWAQAVHPDDAQPTIDAWNQAVAMKRPFVFEHRVRRRDGVWRVFAIRAIPVFEDDGSIREWVGVHTDITEQRIAEQSLRELAAVLDTRVKERTAELERARLELQLFNANLEALVASRTEELKSANAEIQKYAYIVSHDLRSPLINILGFTSELQMSLKAVAAQRDILAAQAPHLIAPDFQAAITDDFPEAIDVIRSAATKMDRLVTAILKVSREGQRDLRPEPVDLTQIAETIRTTMAHQLSQADAGMEIGAMPVLQADRLAVEQVVGNLLDNAIKYLVPGRPGQISVSGINRDGRALITVQDNGRGIDPADHQRVFELFRRAGPQDRPGEGVGLAHVNALVKRMGGRITLASTPGEGSSFTIDLPAKG